MAYSVVLVVVVEVVLFHKLSLSVSGMCVVSFFVGGPDFRVNSFKAEVPRNVHFSKHPSSTKMLYVFVFIHTHVHFLNSNVFPSAY